MSDMVRQHKRLAMGEKVDGGAKGDRGPAQKYAKGGRVAQPSTKQTFKSGGKTKGRGC